MAIGAFPGSKQVAREVALAWTADVFGFRDQIQVRWHKAAKAGEGGSCGGYQVS